MTTPNMRSAALTHRPCISAARQPDGSHNAHNLETVTVYYRWHPLFGLVLPVWRRSKYCDGERIYCKAPDGRICVLPEWMLRPECEQLCLGSALVSVNALVQLYNSPRYLQCSASEGKCLQKLAL